MGTGEANVARKLLFLNSCFLSSAKKKDIMKKLTVLLFGCVLAFRLTALAEPSEADQKWLKTVQKMVAKGEKKVITHDEARVKLVKTWADKDGYTVQVTKQDNGYRLEIEKKKDLAIK